MIRARLKNWRGLRAVSLVILMIFNLVAISGCNKSGTSGTGDNSSETMGVTAGAPEASQEGDTGEAGAPKNPEDSYNRVAHGINFGKIEHKGLYTSDDLDVNLTSTDIEKDIKYDNSGETEYVLEVTNSLLDSVSTLGAEGDVKLKAEALAGESGVIHLVHDVRPLLELGMTEVHKIKFALTIKTMDGTIVSHAEHEIDTSNSIGVDVASPVIGVPVYDHNNLIISYDSVVLYDDGDTVKPGIRLMLENTGNDNVIVMIDGMTIDDIECTVPTTAILSPPPGGATICGIMPEGAPEMETWGAVVMNFKVVYSDTMKESLEVPLTIYVNKDTKTPKVSRLTLSEPEEVEELSAEDVDKANAEKAKAEGENNNTSDTE